MAKWPIGPTRDTAMLRLKLNDLWRSGQIGGGFDGPAADITQTDINNWNAAFSWGNHADAGYLTSETDPTVPAHVKDITATQVGNWDAAFSWGNHADVGYIVGPFSDAIHGDRGGGTLHAVATGSVAGFMSAADKGKLDGLDPDALGFEFHQSEDNTLYWFESAVNLFRVSSISPTSGDELGGTEYTITGTGFRPGDPVTVLFGATEDETATVDNSTTITGTTPAGTGTVDVVVTQGADSGTLTGGFEYTTAPTAWTPADTTTALWLDGDDSGTLTLDGSGNVEQWDDKSGNARHATQSTASLRPPTTTLNTVAALQFADTLMALPELPAGDYSYFLVSDCETKANVSLLGASNNSYIPIAADGSAGDVIRINGSQPSGVLFYTNGGTTNITSRQGAHDAIVTNSPTLSYFGKIPKISSAWEIGRGGGSTSWYHNGPIGEMVVVPGEPTTEIRQKMEGYLAHKWGLEAKLPAGHPYKDSPP